REPRLSVSAHLAKLIAYGNVQAGRAMDHLRAQRAHEEGLLLGRFELDEADNARGAAVVDQLETVHRTVGLAQVEYVARQRMQIVCFTQPLHQFWSHGETMLGRALGSRYPKKHEPAV